MRDQDYQDSSEFSQPLIEAALEIAARGCPVFPCNPKTKSPLTKHGFSDATTDSAMIRRWWTMWPDAMIAAPTGEKMGAWVLDIDDAALFEGSCDIALPNTRKQQSGEGYHLFFAWDPERPVRNAQQSIKGWPFPDLPGCDVRGEGGYIILAPSIHPTGRRYCWVNQNDPCEAPDELLDIVQRRAAPPPPKSEVPLSAPPPSTSDPFAEYGAGDSPYALAALRSECENVSRAPSGAQEATLNQAALKMGGYVSAGHLSYHTAAGQLMAAGLSIKSSDPNNPWQPQTIAAKVDRGIRDGMKTPKDIPASTAAPVTASRNKRQAKQESESSELSQDAIALAFTELHGGNLLFDNHVGKWFHWNDVFWEMDETELAFDFARQLARELSIGMKGFGSAGTARGVEQMARADRRHSVTSKVWDQDPMLLGTPSGTIDLRTGVLNDPDREQRITRQTGVAPDYGVPERWLKFLDEALAGDKDLIKFLQLWSGYCLTGLTSAHALLFIFGPGGNGKSVFLNTLLNIMGTYAAVAAMETFTASKNDRHSTELAMLRGARLVTANETEEGRAWAEAKIKAMTGGDPITARFMRQDNFTFRPQFKLTIAGNHQPSLKSVDDAMQRRFNIAPFILKPASPDRFLEDKLRAEYPQILAWMIAGAREYLASGLTRPDAVIAATNEYFSEQDVFGQWFQERCEEVPGRFDTCAKFYADWVSFSKAHGEEPGSLKSFGMNMGKKGYKSILRRDLGISGKIYHGVALAIIEGDYGDER